MADCVKCGGSGDIPFRALEIHTLHIRDMTGEKRVQALGKTRDFAVCDACARQQLAATRAPGRTIVKKLLPFLAVLAVGVLVTALSWRGGEAALRLMGAAGIFCGITGSISVPRAALRERSSSLALPPEEALRQAAWACLLEAAPKKAGDNDLTYLPIDRTTLAMGRGELAAAFELLPAVAQQAWDRLHGGDSTDTGT